MVNLAEPILKQFRKASVPSIEVGDVVRVHQKIKEGAKERIQVFEGIVIAKHEETSLDATFTVRKIASGVGVEKTYLLHSPNIVKIEFKRSSRVRRAKIYYLRDLTGKALKLKDRKITKQNWDEVLAGAGEAEAQVEPTEADVAEAVAAAAEQEKAELAGDEVEKSSEVAEDESDDTPTNESDASSTPSEETASEGETDAVAGTDAESKGE